MSGERFDSGGVLTRARPVLTFATVVRGEALPLASPRTHTPVPVLMSWSGPHVPPSCDLPVIPRIVRRTAIERLFEPIARGAFTVRRVGGMLLFGALGLATLGVIAGLGLRPSPDESPTPVVSGVAHVFDATATERLFARAPQTLRVERTIPPPTTPAPKLALVAARVSPASSHPAPATARAVKRHAPSTAVIAHR